MKRMIACEECSHRITPSYQGEWLKRVWGTAKHPMLCDWCAEPKEINPGDVCSAESYGLDRQPYWAWESDYIEVAT